MTKFKVGDYVVPSIVAEVVQIDTDGIDGTGQETAYLLQIHKDYPDDTFWLYEHEIDLLDDKDREPLKEMDREQNLATAVEALEKIVTVMDYTDKRPLLNLVVWAAMIAEQALAKIKPGEKDEPRADI